MLLRLLVIACLLASVQVTLATCGSGGADTEAEVTRGGEGKLAAVKAKFADEVAKNRPPEGTLIEIAAGMEQYKRKCAFCHGLDGMKKIPLADESKRRLSKLSPDDIGVQLHTGVNIDGKVRNHKLFPSLKGAELYGTIFYDQQFFLQDTTAKNDTDRFAPWRARLETGKTLFKQHCASCHATATDPIIPVVPAPPVESAEGEQPNLPELPPTGPALDREFIFSTSPQEIFDGLNGHDHPAAEFSAIPEADRWAVVYYLQSLLYTLPPTE